MAFKKKLDISNGTQFKFEEKGQSIEGYYVGSFPHQGDYAPTKKHIFQTEDGLITVFGQKHLIDILEGVNPGTLVRVTYVSDKASKKKGHHPMKMFELEYDDEQVIDVDSIAASAASNDSEPEEDYSEDDVDQEQEEVEQQRPAPRQSAPRQAPRAAASSPAPKSVVSDANKARSNALLGKVR